MAKDQKSYTVEVRLSHLTCLNSAPKKKWSPTSVFCFLCAISLWQRALQTLLGGNSLPSIVRVYCCFIRHPGYLMAPTTIKNKACNKDRTEMSATFKKEERKHYFLLLPLKYVVGRIRKQIKPNFLIREKKN